MASSGGGGGGGGGGNTRRRTPFVGSLRLPTAAATTTSAADQMQVDSATASALSPVSHRGEEIKKMIEDLHSSDPHIVIRGLNLLSAKSHSTLESNDISLEIYPSVIIALGNLLNNLNPIGNLVFTYKNPVPQLVQSGCVFELVRDGWGELGCIPPALLSVSTYNSFKAEAAVTEDNLLVLTVLNIIKNFSLDAWNEQLLAYSEPILRHCVSMLWLVDVQNNCFNNPLIQTDSVIYCLDILVILALRIDLSAKKRTQNYNAWMDDTLAKGYPKATLHFRMSSHMSEETSSSYLMVAGSLLPLIHMHIKASTSRALVIKCLELLTRLAQNESSYLSPMSPDNGDYWLKCPDSFYESLVELLCVSVTSIEPLATADQRYKPPAYLGASFFSDICDTEVQGAALEAIFNMCMPEKGIYTPKIQLRFAQVPKCLSILLKLAEGGRAPKALALLNIFGSRMENQTKFLSIHLDMLQAGYNDDGIADAITANTLIYADNVNPPFQDEK